MGIRIHLLGLVFVATIVSCTGGSDRNDPAGNSSALEALVMLGTIGPEGGSISSHDASLTLIIPAGALETNTEISVQRLAENSAGMKVFQLLPAGLEFNVPATLSVEVDDLLLLADARMLSLSELPLILSSNRDNSALDMLDTHRLEVDSDRNQLLLRAEVSHFSEFVIGPRLRVSLSIDGVPGFAEANASLDDIRVVVDGSTSTNNLISIDYLDRSVVPVIFNDGEAINLGNIGIDDAAYVYRLNYACGESGEGEFAASLKLNFREPTVTASYNSEWVNDTPLLSLQLLRNGFFLEQEYDSGYSINFTSYELTGRRQVRCQWSDTSKFPPLVSLSSSAIQINHLIGVTECPTTGVPIQVTADSSNPFTVSITENHLFVDVPVAEGRSEGGIFQFTPEFSCEGFQLGNNDGVIQILISDTVTGLTSEPIQLPIQVVVQTPP